MGNGDDSLSGLHRALNLPMGDSKKAKTIRHMASGGGGAFAVVLLLNQFPGLVPYVVADDAYQKDRDSVVTMVEKVSTMQTSFVKQESRTERIEELIIRMAERQGISTKATVPETVKVFVPVALPIDTTQADTSKARPR